VTVPALRLEDGQRVQGSRAIAAALHELRPEAGLFPEDPEARAAVQEAERWGEEVLQPVPRRMIRRGLRDSLAQRQWFARVASPLPAPRLVGVALTPVVPAFVAQVGATPERVRRDLAELGALLDHADALIADGVIGGDRPNAADFQIGTSLRMLLAMADAGDAVEGRPSEALARRIQPDYPPVPAALSHLSAAR
jgi:glutathione S-transferase